MPFRTKAVCLTAKVLPGRTAGRVCIRKVGKETSMYAILLASLANGIDKNVPWDDTESSSFLGCD